VPVTYDDSSLARNTTALAISLACTTRKEGADTDT
jgi:hypothetical protein